MRDAIVFAVIFGLLPFVFKRPAIGIMLFTWVSLMNPHRLTYGAAYNFPFAMIIGVVTLVALFARPDPKRLPLTPLTVMLILFMCWMTLTTFGAFEPDRAWTEWNRVMKTLFFVLVSMAALNSEKDTKLFAAVVTLSLAFYGFKGGLFTLMSGGSSRVLGPDGTYITDNNDLALALLTTVPLIWYLHLQAVQRWLKLALVGLALLTITSVLGSYSRGALLGGAAMLAVLWLKSGNKVGTGIGMLLLVPMVYLVMPEEWFGRMESINDYQEDNSALGRLNSWHFAFNLAKDNLMGGGFLTFTPKVFAIYAPNPRDVHAPHSIYFQVMGEHGFVGLMIFLSILLLGWRTGSRMIKYCKDKPDLYWARDLAAMCQVSLAGYAIGGAFLSLAYFDLLYDILIIVVLLEKVLLKKISSADKPFPAAELARSSAKGRA
ncbi:MAG TPA: putative O-glycosylation ligase, exosortase A system-associated [Telluria sp.]